MDKERLSEIKMHLDQLQFEFDWFSNLKNDGIEDAIYHMLNSDSVTNACNRIRVYLSRYSDDLPF